MEESSKTPGFRITLETYSPLTHFKLSLQRPLIFQGRLKTLGCQPH